MSDLRRQALEYHSVAPKGKLSVEPTKPCVTSMDLTMAYSPGVAEPCREIAKDVSTVNTYTGRRNLVGVVSNGTAVLGLGNIGPYASKPVMEGKAVLFKRFADINCFDIELNETDPDKLIEIVKALEPTFGGINLEDIKAPECFKVEVESQAQMDIPVFHDDQHGTAIITAAGLVNALSLNGKELGSIKVVCIGAGASAIACMDLWVHMGVVRENITMLDSKGVIYQGRPGRELPPHKERYAQAADCEARTLEDALKTADVVIGLSSGGNLPEEAVKGMPPSPVIFALANPDPEIPYDKARALRPDSICATGRTDFPNQVNNVLGFPFIFRGALDVAARKVNMEMKLAAAKALAALAREPVPESVKKAYDNEGLEFGPEYIIPKPFDPRVLVHVSSAVAQAAMDTGVAREAVDIEEYKKELQARSDKLSKMYSS